MPMGFRQVDCTVGIEGLITIVALRDFRLPPPSRRELRSSGLLGNESWLFLTCVSGQPVVSVFGNQECKTKPVAPMLAYLLTYLLP